jgi:hypothetical protein
MDASGSHEPEVVDGGWKHRALVSPKRSTAAGRRLDQASTKPLFLA